MIDKVTRYCKNITYSVLMLLIFSISVSQAANHIISLNQNWTGNQLTVTPIVAFSTSEEIKEAIDNGVRIHLIFKTQIYKQKSWWFDEVIENKKLKLELYTFKLGQLYVAKNLSSGEQISFNNYEQLINDCFQIAQINFDLANTEGLKIRSRIMLDYSSLPTTMQLPVLFSSEWNLHTDWLELDIRRPE